jgi:hypothetical protein
VTFHWQCCCSSASFHLAMASCCHDSAEASAAPAAMLPRTPWVLEMGLPPLCCCLCRCCCRACSAWLLRAAAVAFCCCCCRLHLLTPLPCC